MTISIQPYSPIYQRYEGINGVGEVGFEKYQESIGSLSYLDGSNGRDPADPNSHKDRIDKDGNVYSWDQNAKGGQGAWGVSGHIPKDFMDKYVFPFPGANYTNDVVWSSSEQYAEESGLSYTSTSNAYDPLKDVETINSLSYLDGSNGRDPADPNSHKDRMDKDGNVYSWDSSGNNGLGSWKLSGHIPKDFMDKYVFPFPGADYSNNVVWN